MRVRASADDRVRQYTQHCTGQPNTKTGIKWVSLGVSEPFLQYFMANTLPTALFT